MTDETTDRPKPELPRGLPQHGVLVWCERPTGGWFVQPGTDPDKFRLNLQNAYTECGHKQVRERYDDQPGQSLTPDHAFVQKVVALAREYAVVVRLVGPDPFIDPQRQRCGELAQQLLNSLTKAGVVVSLIKATSHVMAEADLYEPSPGGTMSKKTVPINLELIVEHAEH